MEYLFEKCRNALFSSKTKITPHSQMRRNNHMENVFKVLSWNDPFISWCSFIVVNLLFWLMIWLELKVLGLLFLLVAILFFYDYLFCNNGSTSDVEITDELHPDIEQFRCAVNSAFSNMCTIRNQNPPVFCLVMSIFFLILSLITRSMSGILLTYLTILGTFFLPLAYKNLPLQVKYAIENIIRSAFSFQDIIAEDDLIPIQTQCKVGDIDDWESLDTEKTAESVTNSLSELSSMPSFMDAEDNNEILEEDLMPLNTTINKDKTPSVADLSSDSDSELKEIRLKESNGSKDTSSDEGSKFEEGLHFSEETAGSKGTIEKQNKKIGFYNVLSNWASALSASSLSLPLPNFMGVIRSTEQRSISTTRNSGSESEFEVVNYEDVKQ
ncbi:hypothetical protein WA026_008640 [Henosepilachna vigintioctopunctata]|uniref:Reticulon domain-containing protein n=1 Tax=Henosepilachna vigintioctopunctata TaxID=420089 RepID=A0AAW1UGE0_9CUCU